MLKALGVIFATIIVLSILSCGGFELIGGIIGGIFGLIAGLFGLVVGLIGGLIGIFVGLIAVIATVAIPLLILGVVASAIAHMIA